MNKYIDNMIDKEKKARFTNRAILIVCFKLEHLNENNQMSIFEYNPHD